MLLLLPLLQVLLLLVLLVFCCLIPHLHKQVGGEGEGRQLVRHQHLDARAGLSADAGDGGARPAAVRGHEGE